MSRSIRASARTNGDARFRTQNPIPADKSTTDRDLGVSRRGLDEDLGLARDLGADLLAAEEAAPRER